MISTFLAVFVCALRFLFLAAVAFGVCCFASHATFYQYCHEFGVLVQCQLGLFSLFLQFRLDARLVRLCFRCDGGCIFLGFEEGVLQAVSILYPLIGGRFCCFPGGCCARAAVSHASLTAMTRILSEAIRRFKALTMSLHVALVLPARFVECAEKGLCFCPRFPSSCVSSHSINSFSVKMSAPYICCTQICTFSEFGAFTPMSMNFSCALSKCLSYVVIFDVISHGARNTSRALPFSSLVILQHVVLR